MTSSRKLRAVFALLTMIGSLALAGTASADKIIPHPAPGSLQAKADGCLALQLGFQQAQQDSQDSPGGSKAGAAAASDAARNWGSAHRAGCAWAQ